MGFCSFFVLLFYFLFFFSFCHYFFVSQPGGQPGRHNIYSTFTTLHMPTRFTRPSEPSAPCHLRPESGMDLVPSPLGFWPPARLACHRQRGQGGLPPVEWWEGRWMTGFFLVLLIALFLSFIHFYLLFFSRLFRVSYDCPPTMPCHCMKPHIAYKTSQHALHRPFVYISFSILLACDSIITSSPLFLHLTTTPFKPTIM